MTHDSRALFDLPIEKVCGQISAAAEQVLDDPRQRTLLLLALAGEAGHRDAHAFIEACKQSQQSNEVDTDFVDKRNAVAHRIQRNIDGLQISCSLPWRRGLRIAAISLSSVIAYCLSTGESPALDRVPVVMFCGMIGGFFATVARDATAVIEKYRG